MPSATSWSIVAPTIRATASAGTAVTGPAGIPVLGTVARGAAVMRGSGVGFGGPLEDDREPAAVLRHGRELPAAATPLVQEIGERVLIVARMARETQHDRLIFFHAREDTSFVRMDTTPDFPTLNIVSHPLI